VAKSLYDGRIDLKGFAVSEQELSAASRSSPAPPQHRRAMAKALRGGPRSSSTCARTNRKRAGRARIERDGGKAIPASPMSETKKTVYAMC